jgi:hypothetical protein
LNYNHFRTNSEPVLFIVQKETLTLGVSYHLEAVLVAIDGDMTIMEWISSNHFNRDLLELILSGLALIQNDRWSEMVGYLRIWHCISGNSTGEWSTRMESISDHFQTRANISVNENGWLARNRLPITLKLFYASGRYIDAGK